MARLMDPSPAGDPHRSAVALARDRLGDRLKEALGEKAPGSFELLIPPREVEDDIAKILYRTAAGKPRAVVLVAPPLYPRKVTETVDACEAARRSLGDDLGSVILKTLLAGSLDGRSFSVIPYCGQLSGNALWSRVQDARLSPALLDWLRQATKRTSSELSESEKERALNLPLEHLASLKEVSESVRAAAREARRLADEAALRPRTVLMHGDLWRGNIMKPPTDLDSEIARAGIRPFVITDWHGSMLRGYPIYDLVRLALSLRVGPRRLKAELLAHGEILGCGIRHARTYLLAALGHLGLNLHCFPYDAYTRQVEMCAGALERAER